MKSAPDADLLRISGELRHLKDNVEDEVARQQLMFEGFADRQRQTGNALADRIAKLEDRLADAQQEPDAVRRDREVTALAKDIEATRRENEAVVERRRNAERSAAEARDRKEAEEKKIEEFEGPSVKRASGSPGVPSTIGAVARGCGHRARCSLSPGVRGQLAYLLRRGGVQSLALCPLCQRREGSHDLGDAGALF